MFHETNIGQPELPHFAQWMHNLAKNLLDFDYEDG
jgi:hypothetical protein